MYIINLTICILLHILRNVHIYIHDNVYIAYIKCIYINVEITHYNLTCNRTYIRRD